MELGHYTMEREHGTQTPAFHQCGNGVPDGGTHSTQMVEMVSLHKLTPQYHPQGYGSSGLSGFWSCHVDREKESGCGLPFLFYNADFFCLTK